MYLELYFIELMSLHHAVGLGLIILVSWGVMQHLACSLV